MHSLHSFYLELTNPLPETISIKGNKYCTIQLLNALENITGCKITTTKNKVYRNWNNCTIMFKIIPPQQTGEPLRIPSKSGKLIELYSTY